MQLPNKDKPLFGEVIATRYNLLIISKLVDEREILEKTLNLLKEAVDKTPCAASNVLILKNIIPQIDRGMNKIIDYSQSYRH